MPLSYECKKGHIKQNPWKPTKSKRIEPPPLPGPMDYEQPEIIGGNGFNHIARAPAYSFGLKTLPLDLPRPILSKNAPMFNIRGYNKRGKYRVTHGVVSPRPPAPDDNTRIPGPGAYDETRPDLTCKRAPAFSIVARPKPPKKSKDVWTPSANMYWPPIMGKKTPAFRIGKSVNTDRIPDTPGPGQYNPNFNYVVKTTPQVTIGSSHPVEKVFYTPGPGPYCPKKGGRAISFGIKHSPYLGETTSYLKPENLNLTS